MSTGGEQEMNAGMKSVIGVIEAVESQLKLIEKEMAILKEMIKVLVGEEKK